MKNKFKNFMHSFKNGLFGFGRFFKTNILFCSLLLVLETALLVSTSVIILPFDSQCELEITERVTNNALKTNFGYSIISIQMKARGSSDYYIYSDSELQNLQTRNQRYEGEKNYIFPAYKPYGNFVPLSITNKENITISQCSTLLTESKYDGLGFYFDLPIINGTIPRTLGQNEIVITEKLASKLTDDPTFDNIIGESINGKTIVPSGIFEKEYVIRAVLSTDNNLGKALNIAFGDNIVICSEYNTIPLEGYCYMFASNDKNENKILLDYILNNYVSSYKASRYLEVGYAAEYSFYEYDSIKSELFLGDMNNSLNEILNFYSGILPSIFCVFGLFVLSVSLVLSILLFKWNWLKINNHKKGIVIFSLYTISSLSMLIASLLYKFIPTSTIITHQIIQYPSHVTSTVVFLMWVAITFLLALTPFFKKRS